MGFRHCSEEDRKIIGECLVAAVNGPFFPDWEFSTLFGLERAEIDRVARSWPDVDEQDETVALAVNNALANLAGYPHGEDLSRHISATTERLLEILRKWRIPSGSSDAEGGA